MDSTPKVTVEIGAKKDSSFDSAMDGAAGKAKSTFSDIKNQAIGVFGGIGLTAVLARIKGLGDGAIEAAAKQEVLIKKMELTGMSTQQASAKLSEFKLIARESSNETAEGLVMVSNRMERISAGSSKYIRALAGFLEPLGGSVSSMGRMFSLAMNGNQRALMMLDRQFGVNKKTLHDFDAAYDMTGKNVRKNAEILGAYIEKTGGKNLDKMRGTFEQQNKALAASFKGLQRQIGEALLPGQKAINEQLLTYLAIIKKITPEQVAQAANLGKTAFVAGTLYLGIMKLMALQISWAGIQAGIATGINTVRVAMAGLATSTQAAAIAFTATLVAAKVLFDYQMDVQKLQNKNDQDAAERKRIDADNFKQLDRFRAGERLSEKELAMAKVALTKEIMDARSKAGSKYMQGEKEQRDEIQKTIDLMKRKAAAEAKGFTVGFEDHAKTRIANLDREIDKLRERQEMDELDIAGKRQLAKALKEEYDWKLNLGEEEKKIRALKVESAKLMKEAEADETKAQAEKEAAYEKTVEAAFQKDMDYIARKKAANSMGMKEELAYLQRMLDSGRLNAEQREKIEMDVLKVKQDIRKKDLEDANKKAEEEKKFEEQRQEAIRGIDEEIFRMTHTADEIELKEFSDKLDRLREQGVEETKITELVEARKTQLSGEANKKEQADADKTLSKYDEIKRKLDSLSGHRGNSPLMSLEEAMLATSLNIAQGGPASSGGQGAAGGGMSVQQKKDKLDELKRGGMTGMGYIPATPENTTNDNSVKVYIKDVIIPGEAGKMVAKAILDRANRSESVS